MNKKRLIFGFIFLFALSFVFAEPVIITPSTTEWNEEVSDTYVLSEDVTINDRIRVLGRVTLHLNEDCTLDATQGITVHINETLIIEGEGKLIATGPERYAGIGGEIDSLQAGTIIINGGTITATGGSSNASLSGGGAGIGGGGGQGTSRSSGYCRKVEINGGTVTATGGNLSAGIGGAICSNLWECTINGGTVTATGQNGAAGIGGGDGSPWGGGYGGAGPIIINGGKVVAKSTGGGCGLGAGKMSDCTRVEINGGQVTAISGSGYAIGSGSSGTVSNITLNWTSPDDSIELNGSKGGFSYDKLIIAKEFRFSDTGTNGVTVTKYTDGSFNKKTIVPLIYQTVNLLNDNEFLGTTNSEQTFYGSKIINPQAPEKDGSTFKAWYKDRSCTTPWNFASDLVKGDITLYAKYIADEITVKIPSLYDWTGNEIQITPRVTSLDETVLLKKDTDYTISYTDSSAQTVTPQEPDLYEITINGIGDYDGKTCTASFRVIRNPSGAGTFADPYVITSTEDWDFVADNLESGISYSGKYIQLGDDIQIDKPIGSAAHPFDGNFNGQGYAITREDSCQTVFGCIRNADLRCFYSTLSLEDTIKVQRGINHLFEIESVHENLQSGINKIILSSGGQTLYLVGMEVQNMQEVYPLFRGDININPVITLAGQILTKNTDYTCSIINKKNSQTVTTITELGEYTYVLTGTGSYTGTANFDFTIKASVVTDAAVSNTNGSTAINIPSNKSTFSFDATTFSKGYTFNIYDDGGKGGNFLAGAAGNFTEGATGYLQIDVAPGYLIQFSGYVATKTKYDYLTIYDGDSETAKPLYNKVHGENNQNEYIVQLPTVTTSSNKALVFFNGSSWTCEGFELTATIVEMRSITAKEDTYTPGVYYASFYIDDVNYIADENTQVFYAIQDDTGKIVLKEALDKIIQKGQGVVLKATTPEIHIYETNKTTTYTSLLTGTTSGIEDVTQTIEGTVYVLGTGAKGGVGFYKWTGSIGANKAYLRRAE